MKKFILFLFSFPFFSFGQHTFYFNDAIPVANFGDTLKNPWAGGINYAEWSQIDLNQDGNMDLFMFDRSSNRIITLVNDGSPGPGAFHDSSAKYAPMFPPLDGWAVLYDYNCDGLPDLFTVSNFNNGIAQYKSTYNANNWTFTLVNPTMLADYSGGPSNIFASAYLTPNFNDIDSDGDLDIVGQTLNCVGTFAYYRNYSMEDYGVCDTLNDYKLETNSWGNFSLRSGAYCYSQVGNFNDSCPTFGPIKWKPEDAAQKDDTYAQIFLIDLDGDGDRDALLGDAGAVNTLALYNGGNPNWAQVTSQDTAFPSYDTPALIRSFNTFGYVDVDNDGKKDLLVGNREAEDLKNVLFYKNTGTNTAPVFNFQHDSLFVSGMIDVGEAAAPVLYDENNDNLPDLVIGGIVNSSPPDCSFQAGKGSLTLYRNTGTVANPAFQFITNDFANVSTTLAGLQGPFHPAFGDLDDDGDGDMLVGTYNGQLYYFRNDGSGFTSMGSLLNTGKLSAAPQIIDLNGDSLLDLVVGNKNGFLRYFQNAGTKNSPAFSAPPTIDTLGQVKVAQPTYIDGYAVPYFYLDSGMKLLVSNMHGDVLLYDSIDNNLNGVFRVIDTVLTKDYGNRFGVNLSVSGGDINGDGYSDMLLGLFGGGVQVYYHDYPVGVTETEKPNVSFDIFPNPATDRLNLRFHYPDSKQNSQLSIFNSVGQVVYSAKVTSPKMMIELKKFSNGLYLVQFLSDNKCVSRKMVVSH